MQTRIQISPEVIKKASIAAAASASSNEIHDYNDTSQPYLTLRQRGRSVRWLVRAYRRSRMIGSAIGQHVDPTYLGLREARERSKTVYAELGIDKIDKPAVEQSPPPAWTWADLDREYQASLKEPRWSAGRVKPPSKGTRDDVRLAFKKPSIAALGPTALTDLTSLGVIRAIEAIHTDHGHRAACKALAYIKSALNWALSKRGEKSGLHGAMPWWSALRPPDPTGTEITEIQARRRSLTAAKVAFGVDHLGALLVAHEDFCRGRSAEQKISPGVRWGLWWVAFTGNRRFSTVALERDRLLQVDEFGRDGWGRAMWPVEMMKGRAEFWLPLPPPVLALANGAIADWTQLVRNESGHLKTRWVFASTRRRGRDPDNDDVAVYPNSLNAHLRALRGDKKGFNEGVNRLKGLPWFSLHLVRSVAGNYLDSVPGVPKAGISAMLAHADDNDADDRLAPTTRAFYVQNQRMHEKTDAMAAWSDALVNAVEKAGGTLPEARETNRSSKLKARATFPPPRETVRA